MRSVSISKRSVLASLFSLVLASGATGCGSSDGSAPAQGGGPPPAPGSLNLYLVDAIVEDYQELNLNIQKVEVATASPTGGESWVTLGTPNKTVNVLTLVGGNNETLATGVSLPSGSYSKVRLHLGADSTVRTVDGLQPLLLPEALAQGVLIDADIHVDGQAVTDAFLDLDTARSIQVVTTGGVKKFVLHPMARAVDTRRTGSISGRLVAAKNGEGLGGAVVYAERTDINGQPIVVRSTVTAADGTYNLDLLPLGQSYYVVSMPKVDWKVYDPQASAAIALSPESPVGTFSATFTQNSSTGGISGSVTPAVEPDENDHIDLAAELPVGAGKQRFVVRTTTPQLTTRESFRYDSIPSGFYGVQVTRASLGERGDTRLSSIYASGSFGIAVSATTLINLSL